MLYIDYGDYNWKSIHEKKRPPRQETDIMLQIVMLENILMVIIYNLKCI
jgi:hypothetical protein